MVEAEIVTGNGSEIVWLAWMCVGIVSGERDAVLLQVGKTLVNCGLGEVLCKESVKTSMRCITITTHLVLQPNGDESVKDLSLDDIRCGAHSVQGCQAADKGSEKGIPHCVSLVSSTVTHALHFPIENGVMKE